jgi:hypothetical protein
MTEPQKQYVYVPGLPGGYTYSGWTGDFPFPDMRSRLNVAEWASLKGVRWDGDPPPMFPPQLDDLGIDLREQVIKDAFVKLNEPKFNTAVFLAELDETIVGIHGLFKNMWRTLLYAKAQKRNLKHLLLNPEEAWLWFRYMLMPLMMDVESLIGLVLDKDIPVDRVQDGDRNSEPLIDSGTFIMKGHGRGYVDISCPWTSEVNYGCGSALDVLFRYDPAPYGSSLQDIIAAGWERIPFSFIFDWFVNVGDWLATLRDVQFTLAQSYATYAVESKVTVTGSDPYNLCNGPQDLEVSAFSMSRITDIEPPTLPLVDARWRNTLRTLDLISLIIGTIKSVLKRR